MDTSLAPIDVAQHLPFIDRQLTGVSPAVRRALWLVAEGQVDTDGEPTPVRARGLGAGDTPGEAGRTSVVLNELEGRSVLVRYRGRGRRPHLWSFRPRLEHWQGFHWGSGAGEVCEAIDGCFCRAAGDLVARFPGQSVVELKRRAKFELLSRDHISPPGLFLVETRDNVRGRATSFRPAGLFPVDTRDKPEESTDAVLSYRENSSNSLMSDEERDRFSRLKHVLEHHAAPEVLIPGSAPERRLQEIARHLTPGACQAVFKTFDNSAQGKVRIPSGVAMLEKMAERYLPKAAAAL